MKQAIIDSALSDVRRKFARSFPQLVSMAEGSPDAASFKGALESFVAGSCGSEAPGPAARQALRLIEYDGRAIGELSTGETLEVKTISLLWRFLRREDAGEPLSPDLFIDLYNLFRLLEHPETATPDRSALRRQMGRWPSGLDEEVMAVRAKNKERIVAELVRKIERRHVPTSAYHFEEGMTAEEKRAAVLKWWESSRFHLAMAVKSPGELNHFLGYSLPDETMETLAQARKKGMPFFVTPYYLSLLDTNRESYDDATLRSYIIYTKELVEAYGNIKAWEKEDRVVPGEPNAAGWLLPDEHCVHRRYPDVAILIPDSIGRSCGGLCASCQRMYDFQRKRLNFDFESLKPKETWDKKLRRLMAYFEEDTQLRDILITGGDALMSQNATLRKILDAVFRMAVRKRKANERLPDGKKRAEIQRVRLGSRLPAYLPMRITGELLDILREYRERSAEAGIPQLIVQTHFQSPLEMTPEALRAIKGVLEAGWTVTNQLVYNVAASRRGHTAKLRRVLNEAGVICYYTFSVKGFRENYAPFTPICRSLQERQEEKAFGAVPPEKRDELCCLVRKHGALGRNLSRFLKDNRLPFAATDRSVLNLPGIGKSMTFETIGITADGRRILKFNHDTSRRHSPIIEHIGEVYIVENKSVAAYLRQLKGMGEDLSEYRTLWGYYEGETEPRFSIYEYPGFPFKQTDEMSNLKL